MMMMSTVLLDLMEDADNNCGVIMRRWTWEPNRGKSCFVVVITATRHLFTHRSQLHQTMVWIIGGGALLCETVSCFGGRMRVCVWSIQRVRFLGFLCISVLFSAFFVHVSVGSSSTCLMQTCMCVCECVYYMNVFQFLLVPSGSSRVPDPISCCCWQRDIQARGSRDQTLPGGASCHCCLQTLDLSLFRCLFFFFLLLFWHQSDSVFLDHEVRTWL